MAKPLYFFRAVIDDAATACNESEAALSETESIENVTDVVDVSSNDNLISNDDQSQTNTDSLLIQPEDQACNFQTQTEICKPNNEIPTMKPSSSKVMTVLGSTDSKTALNDKLKVYDVSDRRLFDARSLCSQVSPEATTDTFLTVAKSFFSDGVYNWGRVGSLFYFAYKMVVKALNKIALIRAIINWVVNFITDYVAPWIIERGVGIGANPFISNNKKSVSPGQFGFLDGQ
ncbi:BAX [Mytilus edulis]|uniref:BAX n=1 Tax=Mytilus edulis TaxID=6550 RepID=A0A8S3UAD5_MYTED|nr:BAX [Mytilus edulis]